MIWILFIVAIIILSIIVMMKGWNKLHCNMFYVRGTNYGSCRGNVNGGIDVLYG